MSEKIKNTQTDYSVRDTLFGDLPLDYWANIDCNETPWNLFKDAKESLDKGDNEKAMDILKNIISLPALESRQYLQAYHFLNNLGLFPQGDIKIFGIVVEVGMSQGCDLLAIYKDHSARYYNYSGGGVIWETSDKTMDDKMDDVLAQGMEIVKHIGPWTDLRRQPPENNMARLNFLTSHGLHFGEAPQSVLFGDPFSNKIMYALLEIRDDLLDKTSGTSH